MSKTFYISTPIYYPSGKPHVGHAFSTILADSIAKYKSLVGYDTFFVTGTDEHGKKIEEYALKANLPIIEYVNKHVDIFKKLWEKLGINYNCFVRTSDSKHVLTVQKIFTEYFQNDLIYLDNWKAMYCVSCEENILSKDIQVIDNKLHCSIGHLLIETSEPSYFFKMNQFNNWITHTISEKQNWIFPSNRVTELKNNFLTTQLTDLSISRTSFAWGIPILENQQHVIYVWMDALFSYLTALNYKTVDDALFQKFWNHKDAEIVHLLSKEITRFHCVYWPIFLHALNLQLPTKIISHGWIVTKEGKMSKSLGNVIDPLEIINTYGRDCLRYYLIKEMSLSNDNVFAIETMIGIYNGDMANNIGNLVSRTIGMLQKYRKGICPIFKFENLDEADLKFKEKIDRAQESIIIHINELQINKILDEIQTLINHANKYIEETKPWEHIKQNVDSLKIDSFLNLLFNTMKICFYWLQPILIDGTQKASEQININFSKLNIDDLKNYNMVDNISVNNSIPIYERIKI